MRETSELPTASLRAPNPHPSSYPQSPRTPRDDAKFAVGKIRQNTTESHTMQRKLVPARTRARGIPSRHSREGGNPRARPRSVPFSAWIGFDASLGVAVP